MQVSIIPGLPTAWTRQHDKTSKKQKYLNITYLKLIRQEFPLSFSNLFWLFFIWSHYLLQRSSVNILTGAHCKFIYSFSLQIFFFLDWFFCKMNRFKNNHFQRFFSVNKNRDLRILKATSSNPWICFENKQRHFQLKIIELFWLNIVLNTKYSVDFRKICNHFVYPISTIGWI